jgi:hypothetical protein
MPSPTPGRETLPNTPPALGFDLGRSAELVNWSFGHDQLDQLDQLLRKGLF